MFNFLSSEGSDPNAITLFMKKKIAGSLAGNQKYDRASKTVEIHPTFVQYIDSAENKLNSK